MQKIMFNHRYGLHQAVLERIKETTRRLITEPDAVKRLDELEASGQLDEATVAPIIGQYSRYKVGETIAVAQCYREVYEEMKATYGGRKAGLWWRSVRVALGIEPSDSPAYGNKSFVRAEFMPHQIRITDIRIERLRSISTEDCFREGIIETVFYPEGVKTPAYQPYGFKDIPDDDSRNSRRAWLADEPRTAFVVMLSQISGDDRLLETDPWVFVYEFKLIR